MNGVIRASSRSVTATKRTPAISVALSQNTDARLNNIVKLSKYGISSWHRVFPKLKSVHFIQKTNLTVNWLLKRCDNIVLFVISRTLTQLRVQFRVKTNLFRNMKVKHRQSVIRLFLKEPLWITVSMKSSRRVAVISAKNHKSQHRKRQSVTAKREKSQTPKVLTAILTLPNLT